MVTSRISFLVMMQPLKSFKPCWSSCWILTSQGLWNSSADMDYLIRLQTLDLEGWVVCLPAIVVYGSNSISFSGCSLIRIICSTTSGSVSLVHGFTYDKSVPYPWLIPQARSQQQTEIPIHLLKKVPPVNDISGVVFSRPYVEIFSTNMDIISFLR